MRICDCSYAYLPRFSQEFVYIVFPNPPFVISILHMLGPSCLSRIQFKYAHMFWADGRLATVVKRANAKVWYNGGCENGFFQEMYNLMFLRNAALWMKGVGWLCGGVGDHAVVRLVASGGGAR